MKLFGIKKEKKRYIIYFLGIKFSIRRTRYLTEQDVYQILNTVLDIQNCPKARGKLRKLQIADTLLLKFFHNICEKHNIKYWLADGTFLGAIRHNGFIPWDDDLDVGILYDDYEKVVNILQDELKNTDFSLYGVDKSRLGNATLRITHNSFPFLNLDIFYYYPSSLTVSDKLFIEKKWNKYNKLYYKKYKKIKKKESYQVLKNFRDEINIAFINEVQGCDIVSARTMINQVSSDFRIFDKNWIFPLLKHQFEDFEFYVPNNSDKVLISSYGDYMAFPPNTQHHGSIFTDFDEEKVDNIIATLKQQIGR